MKTIPLVVLFMLTAGATTSFAASPYKVVGFEVAPNPADIVVKDSCRPEWPQSSLRNSETGTVELKVMINAEGIVTRTKLATTSGFRDLDRATMIGYIGCKFTPVASGGVANETWFSVQYEWKIETDSRAKSTSWVPYDLLPGSVGCTRPEWPLEAQRYEIEGVTTMQFEVDRDGKVANPIVQKSSGWKILDDAASRSLAKCQFAINSIKVDDQRQYPLQFVWKFSGAPFARPVFIQGSCKPAGRPMTYLDYDRRPSNAEGILMRFLVNKDGTPNGIVAESNGQADRLVGEAISFLNTCRFAPNPDPVLEKTDTSFGRVIFI